MMSEPRRAVSHFAVRLHHGTGWKAAVPMRAQPLWAEHAAFMDGLTAEGFVVLGGPLSQGDEVLLVIAAADVDVVRARLAADPWHQSGQLRIDRVEPWTILLDGRR